MENKKRVLGILNSNIPIPTRYATRLVESEECQENSVKRIKLDKDGKKNCKILKRKELAPEKNKTTCENVKAREINGDVEQNFLEDTVSLDDLWVSSTYMSEDTILKEMQLDQRIQISQTYCRSGSKISAIQRELVLEWLIQLQEDMKVDSQVLHLSISVLDVYFDKEGAINSDAQTIAASAFWLSLKYYCRNIQAKSICKYGNISKTLLLLFERRLFQESDFNLFYTNLSTVVNYYLIRVFKGPIPRTIYCCTNFLIDLMFIHVAFLAEPYSIRAIAGLFTSLCLLQPHKKAELWNLILPHTKAAVQRIHQNLLQILQKISTNKKYKESSVLYKKYSSRKHRMISVKILMYVDFHYKELSFATRKETC